MKCELCSKEADKSCSKCYKTHYCSKLCQTNHWKVHKNDCFPVKIASSPELGRYLVATKNIKQWDVILKEKPIVSGPIDTEFEIVCLGCFNIITQTYKNCSTCKWPVCGSECEKIPDHADFECLIFKEKSVDFESAGVIAPYRSICTLRCLSMKQKYPDNWKNIMTLGSQTETKMNRLLQILTKDGVRFIHNKCKLTEFSQNEISHIFGVFAENAFGGEDDSMYVQRSSSYLCKIASLTAHDCVPNCYRIMSKDSKIELRASVNIQMGNPVTTFYVDTWLPTYCRQFNLRNTYSFSCSCKRCLDPTELGSYFSSIKCSQLNQGTCTGYLIPINPTEKKSQWKCTTCELHTDGQLVRDFNFQFETVVKNIPAVNTLDKYRLADEIAQDYQKRVHPNHYELIKLEYGIAERIHISLATKNFGNLKKQMLERLLTICQHLLDVSNIIRPGFTISRGKILYFMQHGLIVKLLQSKNMKPRPNNLRQEIAKIEEMRTIALKIFSAEPGTDVSVAAMVARLMNPAEMMHCKKGISGV